MTRKRIKTRPRVQIIQLGLLFSHTLILCSFAIHISQYLCRNSIVQICTFYFNCLYKRSSYVYKFIIRTILIISAFNYYYKTQLLVYEECKINMMVLKWEWFNYAIVFFSLKYRLNYKIRTVASSVRIQYYENVRIELSGSNEFLKYILIDLPT